MATTKLQRLLLRNPYVFALIVLVIAIIINHDLQPNLFERRSLSSNFRLFLPLALVAAGQTLVIIGGGIDLSVGAIITLINAILATQIASDATTTEILTTIGIACLAGIFAGVFNGLCIAYLRLQPIVTTYATSFVYGGLALYILPRPEGSLPRSITTLYRETPYNIPFPAYMMGLLIIAWLLLRTTRYSQTLYASGGKADAAYRTGIPVVMVKFSSYVLSGLMAAIAGLALTMGTGRGSPRIGDAMTLDSIVAVVLGGTRLSGGQGGVVGTVLGVMTLGIIRNIISFAEVPNWYQTLVNALIIIAALAGPGLVRLIRDVAKTRLATW
ncbi:MAG: ABC transporter permease [Anaerolineae bacterium]|nr:ABC transporter permease [Anaerolineae bacterium]